MGNLNYSKAICWIDDCRIPFVDEKVNINTYNDGTFDPKNNLIGISQKGKKFNTEQNTQGRFPANLLVSDDMLNDGVISGGKDFEITNKNNNTIDWGFQNMENRFIKQDKGTNSRYYDIDKWFEKLLNFD